MRIKLNPTYRQHLAYEKLFDHTTIYVLFGGAAGGGKSWLISEWVVLSMLRYPGTRYFIAREELKRLRSSTLITFFKCLKHHAVPPYAYRYNGQDNYLQFANSSRVDLLDVKYLPSDPMFERFGSTEYTAGAIDEAGETHFKAFDVLKSRIGRWRNDELNIPQKILLASNPKKNWLYTEIYKPYKSGTLSGDYAFIPAYAADNPYLPQSYIDNLDSIRDKVLKQRLKYGIWEYDDSDGILMPFESIVDLFTNSFIRGGEGYISCDAARFGSDKAVIIRWEGMRVAEVKTYDVSSTTDIETAIRVMCESHNIPRSRVVVDEDGVGGGIVDHLKCIGFVNNSRAVNGNYQNLRSECYFKLAEAVNEGLLFIADDRYKEQMIAELEVLKRDKIDSDNKLSVVPKAMLKDLLGHSPDFSDALMMRMIFELRPQRRIIRA